MVHDQCAECIIHIFPRSISKLFKLLNPIAGFIVWKADATAFAVNSQITWEDDAIVTRNEFVLGRNMRVLFVVVSISPRDLIASSEYTVKVGDCVGKITIRLF